MQPVPQGKAASNDDADQKADQEEQAIGRKRDKENGDDSKSDDQRRRSLQSEAQAWSRFRGHTGNILAPLSHAEQSWRLHEVKPPASRS